MNATISRPPSSRFYRRIIFTIALIIILIVILRNIFVILEPTERGVVFKRLTSGLDVENVRSEGLNMLAPWNRMIRFDISEQQIEETMDVLSVDGLQINIDVSIRFKPKEKEIGLLYESFRADYIENLVRPELRSEVRRIIGQYTPEQLYATKRQEIENAIIKSTEKRLDAKHVELTALLFRSITLPTAIQKSIEEKLAAEQVSQKKVYEKRIAEEDANIAITQAKGKAEANRILSASLTDKILQEKGITATEALANSPNTKIIIIGSGKDGLPIILGGD